MSEMVQKVASAIRTYAVRMWGAPHLYAVVKSDAWDTPILSGMSDGIAYVEAAKLNARAAIEAMREPSPAMIAAAWTVFDRHPHKRLGPGPGFKEAIAAALDAALKE